ncbi:MAG TPA: DUF1549 domain-containing protein [Gemmataceae bacterium]|nr:DUF1549 domain-containing protein [Gemmataceae bacterium]
MLPYRTRLGSPLAFCLFTFAPAFAFAEAPLHERIDQAIAAAQPDFAHHAAGPASDAEFLRRIYLDLIGTIPTAAESRAFLRDSSPVKRQTLIDRLLASPEHARHLATVLDVMLMERRRDKYVPHAQWLEFLRSSVAANKPWDQLVREILTSDGADSKTRPAAKFYLEREAEPNLLTRDISRLFLGTNLQCCQCHDHPRIDDYKQAHYYGLFAFLNRSSLIVDQKLKMAVLSEKADGEVTFQSVFDPAKVTKSTGPRLPEAPPIKEPAVEKGKEYLTAPAPKARAVPRFSRRALLGPSLARADNEQFKRNIANRLWALMMGRGLVHPLDLDHSANPPSHPELLKLLADDIAARKFDMRGFLRELALSQTYQRSSEQSSLSKEPEAASYTVALLKPLTPEQLAWSLMQATGLTDAEREALGKKANEAALYARLSANKAPFVRTFGNPPGQAQEFDARLDQALFLANGSIVRGWLAPRPGNLIDRLTRLTNTDALAEELYLSVFTRLPSAEERKEAANFLASRSKDRLAALQDMAWALLASAEFRFNH